MKRALLLVLVTAALARAERAPDRPMTWSTGGGDLPPRAHLVLWSDRSALPTTPKLVAKIGGKRVPTKLTAMQARPFEVMLVDIDSDATGKLELAWDPPSFAFSPGAFTIAAKPTYPTHVKVTLARYHREERHTKGVDISDGLAITIDVPATRAHVKLRRDAKAPWTELDIPVHDHVVEIGTFGAVRNYEPGLLEKGVDIAMALTLPDGTTIDDTFTASIK